MTTRLSMLAFTAMAVGVLGALTGCGDDPTDSVSTPAAGRTGTPSASHSVSATPSPSTEPVAATCENLVDAATLADFSARGLAITPPATFGAKLQAEGNYLAGFVTAGGVACQVGLSGGSEASELYAWAPFVEADAIPIQSGLTAEGWTVAATSTGGALYSLAAGSEDIIFRCLFTDTQMACAVNDARLAEVLANAQS